jgi:methionyl-tRNA synthetase
LCVLLSPVMPDATREIWAQLGLNSLPGAATTPAEIDPAKLTWGELPEGTAIGDVRPIFPRIDKVKIMKEIEAQVQEPATHESTETASETPAVSVERQAHSGTHATEADAVMPASAGDASAASEPRASTPASETKPAPPMTHATEAEAVPGVSSFIDITDFTKVELRVGEVLTAERIPKADKLLLLSVDIGEEKPRQILAGIAQYYQPEQLLGRKIAVVANLKPRKLRGYESQGMLLAASFGEEGKPVIATFTEEVPNGSRLK